jgi:hypothetical protein
MIFLSNSWWSDFLGFLGVIITIISFIFAIVFYRRQRIFKEISYQVLSDAPIVNIDKRVKDKIRIIYADKDSSEDINDAHLLVLKAWNSGKVDVKVWNSKDPIVKHEDYEVPIGFEFKGRKVLSYGVEPEPCPVPDIINTATRRGIGSNGQQTEELYARVQTQSGAGKHAARHHARRGM